MRSATIFTVAATLFAGAFAACSPQSATFVQTNDPSSAPTAGQTLQMSSNFEVTWQPNTPGPITILLLAGPTAANLSVIATIASNINNSGSYNWTVPAASSGLTSTLTSGYGLQFIDESQCTYQFSPNFGIENPNAVTSTVSLRYASTTVVSVVTGASGTGTGTAKVTSPVLLPTNSMSVPASLQSTTAQATAAATTAAASTSKGLAMPTAAVGWKTGAMVAAGMMGALVL